MFRSNKAVPSTRETIPDIRNICINFTNEISGRKEPTDCYGIYQRRFMCTSYAGVTYDRDSIMNGSDTT